MKGGWDGDEVEGCGKGWKWCSHKSDTLANRDPSTTADFVADLVITVVTAVSFSSSSFLSFFLTYCQVQYMNTFPRSEIRIFSV